MLRNFSRQKLCLNFLHSVQRTVKHNNSLKQRNAQCLSAMLMYNAVTWRGVTGQTSPLWFKHSYPAPIVPVTLMHCNHMASHFCTRPFSIAIFSLAYINVFQYGVCNNENLHLQHRIKVLWLDTKQNVHSHFVHSHFCFFCPWQYLFNFPSSSFPIQDYSSSPTPWTRKRGTGLSAVWVS